VARGLLAHFVSSVRGIARGLIALGNRAGRASFDSRRYAGGVDARGCWKQFDEVIISTLPHRVSHWLRFDLTARVERLGLPVTVVMAAQSEQAWKAA